MKMKTNVKAGGGYGGGGHCGCGGGDFNILSGNNINVSLLSNVFQKQ
jgi:hypothetical protein